MMDFELRLDKPRANGDLIEALSMGISYLIGEYRVSAQRSAPWYYVC